MLAEHIEDLPGTGIVYTLTVRDAEQVSEWLNGRGILVRPYHASVTHERYADSNAYRQRRRPVEAEFPPGTHSWPQ